MLSNRNRSFCFQKSCAIFREAFLVRQTHKLDSCENKTLSFSLFLACYGNVFVVVIATEYYSASSNMVIIVFSCYLAADYNHSSIQYDTGSKINTNFATVVFIAKLEVDIKRKALERISINCFTKGNNKYVSLYAEFCVFSLLCSTFTL